MFLDVAKRSNILLRKQISIVWPTMFDLWPGPSKLFVCQANLNRLVTRKTFPGKHFLLWQAEKLLNLFKIIKHRANQEYFCLSSNVYRRGQTFKHCLAIKQIALSCITNSFKTHPKKECIWGKRMKTKFPASKFWKLTFLKKTCQFPLIFLTYLCMFLFVFKWWSKFFEFQLTSENLKNVN